jgi:capsular exopolysaccharide synthesis family protein
MPALVDGPQYAPPLSFEGETPLAGRVAGRPASEGLSLHDIWRIVLKRKWVILALTVIGAVLGSVYSATRVRLYEATSTVDINPTATNLGISDLIEESLSSSEERMPTEIAHMSSNEVVFRTIKELSLKHLGPFPHAFDKLPDPQAATIDSFPAADVQGMIGSVKGGLKMVVLPNTNIVSVSFQDTNPIVARDIVNTLINVYFQKTLDDTMSGTGRVANWLHGQMEQMRETASDAQAKLAQFQKDHGLVGGDENDSLVVDRLRAENAQLTQLEAERIVKEAKLRILKSDDPDLVATIGPSSTLTALRGQQLSLRSEYNQYTTKFGQRYPRVEQLRQQLANVQQQIDAEMINVKRRVEDDYQTTLHTQDLLQSKIDVEMQNVYKLNTSAAQYAVLRQDAESSRELYEALQLRLKESTIAAGLNTGSASVIDQAMTPLGPVNPSTTTNSTVSGALGFVLGVLLAFILDSIDDTLRTTEDVEATSGLLSLGAIPNFQAGQREVAKAGGLDGVAAYATEVGVPDKSRLISIIAPSSQAAEAYRALRSSILLSAIDNPLRLLVVTSAFMSEGKSTLSANLGVMLAQRGERVLIVDADLRRSTLHLLFGLSRPALGLTNLLSRQTGDSAFLHPVAEMPNLTYLPAGAVPPNPAELLASHRMAEMMRQWQQEYDRVIIDTAPILAVSDSLAPAARADAVLLIVRAGVTRKKALVRARELLRRANASVLGAVVNDIDLRADGYYGYSSGYTYGYGYSADAKDERNV